MEELSTDAAIRVSSRAAPDTTDRDPNLLWFVAQLKPSGFVCAKLNLHKQGFETFMPLRETEVRHARKVTRVMRPLFPGYIFVSFDPDRTQWRAINNTFGVSSLVICGTDTPQVVSPALIQNMRSRCNQDDQILPPETFARGNLVKVINGPFKDIIAEVEHLSNSDRIAVLFDLMGRTTRITVRRENLEIAAT